MTPVDKNLDTDDTTKDADAVPSTSDTDTATGTADELTTSAAEDVEPSASDSGAEPESGTETAELQVSKSGLEWPRILAFGVLPVLALLLGAAAGFLKWQDSSVRDTDFVRIESMQIAKDAAVRLLSYKPDTVEQDLGSAQDLLTGEFRNSYAQLINDVVIPGSKERQISAVATVPAAASVSAEPNEAVVLVFVNQTVMVGTDAPTATTSSVQVTMERVGDRWLISEFEPV